MGWFTNWHAHNDRRSFSGSSRNFDLAAKDGGAFTHTEQPERMRSHESLRRYSNAVVLNFERDHPVPHFQVDPDLSSLRMARNIGYYFLKNAEKRCRLFTADAQILFRDAKNA